MFKVVTTGKKTHQKSWKRIFTKPISFVKDSPGRTRSQRGSLDLLTHLPPMGIGRLTLPLYSRPMGLRQKFAHVNHLTSGVTLKAPIFSVKKNPQDPMCTRPGVLTGGAVVEVNVSELGLTTTSGKAVWGRYAQTTDNPEGEGTVNA